jgi:hypothetical protein
VDVLTCGTGRPKAARALNATPDTSVARRSAGRGVCRSAGVLLFDTATWSPRSMFAKVFAHRPSELIARIGQVGLQVTARQDAFSFALPLQPAATSPRAGA